MPAISQEYHVPSSEVDTEGILLGREQGIAVIFHELDQLLPRLGLANPGHQLYPNGVNPFGTAV